LTNKNLRRGVLFAILSLLLVSMQPIITIARPKVIDVYIFAAMTCLIEALIFLPLFLIERKSLKLKLRSDPSDPQKVSNLLIGWKKNVKFLIYLGINFAIAQVLFFLAYQLSGAINGAIAQQSSILFALLFGFIMNHEKISKIQIFFSIVLLFGLMLAITQGTFNLIEFNIGVLIMLITTMLWMLAHTLTKPILERGELTSTQLVFIRNSLSGLILFSTYFIFFPISNSSILFNPLNIFFFIAIGVFYSGDLYCWYKSISNIKVSKASIIVSPMPILTAFFAYIFLSEIFTIYHLIGALIIIFSIYMIVREEEHDIVDQEKDNQEIINP